jgi:hypothetical protein
MLWAQDYPSWTIHSLVRDCPDAAAVACARKSAIQKGRCANQCPVRKGLGGNFRDGECFLPGPLDSWQRTGSSCSICCSTLSIDARSASAAVGSAAASHFQSRSRANATASFASRNAIPPGTIRHTSVPRAASLTMLSLAPIRLARSRIPLTP